MFYWTKTDSEFRSNGQFLWIPSIGREGSGTYTCFAENIYSSGNIGKANGTIEIDVQCQLINIFARYIIVYSIKANLTSLWWYFLYFVLIYKTAYDFVVNYFSFRNLNNMPLLFKLFGLQKSMLTTFIW